MEENMDKDNLKLKLIGSLEKIYYMEAFGQLVEFLQGELYLLRFLALNIDEKLNPSQLSKSLHMSRPRITATISGLKKKGFVITKQDKKDRRRLIVEITQKGLEFVKEKQGKVEENFDEFINGLGEKDTIELIRIVNLAADIMEIKQKHNNGE